MAIEYIEQLPGRARNGRGRREPYPKAEIEEFLSNTNERYAKVTIEGKEPKNMAQSFRLYLKKNPEIAQQVAIHFVGGELYLERLD